jgi:hypothetical protein
MSRLIEGIACQQLALIFHRGWWLALGGVRTAF